MKTDDLMRALAADTTVARPLPTVLLWGLLPALGLGVLALWASIGLRADLAQSVSEPLSVARFVLTGALGLICLRLVLVLGLPDGQLRAQFWPLAVLALVTLGVLAWGYAATPAEGRQMALVGKTMTTCLIAIPLLSVLPVAAVLAMLRHGATTAPRLASGLAGLAGGGAAAAVYALHCTEDSPLFYVTWYGLAIAIVAVIAGLIGPRFLRW